MSYQIHEVAARWRRFAVVPRGGRKPDPQSAQTFLDEFAKPAIAVEESSTQVVGVNRSSLRSLLGRWLSDVDGIVAGWGPDSLDSDRVLAGSTWLDVHELEDAEAQRAAAVATGSAGVAPPRRDTSGELLAAWALFLGSSLLILTGIGAAVLLVGVLGAEVEECRTTLFGDLRCSDIPDPDRGQNAAIVVGAALLEVAAGTLLLVGAVLLRRRSS